MTPTESFTEGIYTVDLFRDECPSNPRDDDCHFLWLGFPHRRYAIGDVQIDPAVLEAKCEACAGTGAVQGSDDMADCPTCDGQGWTRPSTLIEIMDWAAAEYDAIHVFPVGMIDHSGTAYYLGGGAHPHDPGGWDSGTWGLMLFTKQQAADWGLVVDEEEIHRQMRLELEEYTSWANGDVWFHRLRLADDYEPTDEDRMGWMESVSQGFEGGLREWCENTHDIEETYSGDTIGWDNAVTEAKAALAALQPTKENA